MAFTDRFVELPSTVCSKKDIEVMGESNAPEYEVTVRINPFEISSYEESDIYADKGNWNYTHLSMKNGDNMCIHLPVKEFEKRLNEFVK